MASALKELSDQDIVQKVREQERELVRLRFRHSSNQLENTATMRKIRKEIARMHTELRAREMTQGLGPNALLQRHSAKPAEGTKAPAEQPVERGGFLKGIVDRLAGRE